MIPELGHFSLWIALGVALVLGVMPMLGAARGRGDWMALARPSARLLFALVAFAFACLTVSFINNDFSVAYVATNSNRLLPMHYRITGVWGGHEGSILLWLLMLTFWTLAVATFSDHLPAKVQRSVIWPDSSIGPDADLDECVVAGVNVPAGFTARRAVLVPASVVRPEESVQIVGGVAVFPFSS